MTPQETPPEPTQLSAAPFESFVNVKQVHLNVEQEIIVITVDRITMLLREHLNEVESKKGWIAPIGILLAILLTFVTSDFHSNFLFDAATWRAVFFLCALGAGGVFAYTAWFACSSWWRSETLDKLVNKMKQESKGS
jgi:hypothetical protein